MNKYKYKMLIIDDEESRNTAYLNAFGKRFDVTIINDIANLTIPKVANYDLFLIDVVLGIGSNSNAFSYMESLKITAPTVIISGQWINDGAPSQSILKVPKFNNIIDVINWNSIANEDPQRICEDIFIAFCKYKNLMLESKKDVCTILQISDLQFGGDVSSAALNDASRISTYLKNNNISPDLVVVAGDIANTGAKTEYNEAQNWFTKFITLLWGNYNVLIDETVKEKVIFTAGNHDYDLSISASDNYHFKFKSLRINDFEKKAKDNYSNQKLGFYNFSRFLKDFTKEDDWLQYTDHAIHYNHKFINWGINLITVNSAYKINNQNCENRFDKFYCDFSSLEETDLPSDNSMFGYNDSLCNILIMHNPPSDFKGPAGSCMNSWQKLQTIIEDNKVNLCLYGHTHDNNSPYSLRDNGGYYCKNLICVPSPSLRLKSASINEEAHRGFNIIELYKQNGIIDKIIVRRFELVNATINEIEEDDEYKTFKVNYKTNT